MSDDNWQARTLGRWLRLRFPVEAQSTSLLFPVYEAAVASLTVFGPCSLPPLDEVKSVVENLLTSMPRSERIVSWVEVSSARVDDLQLPDIQTRVDIIIGHRSFENTPIDVRTAPAEVASQSPLAGLPLANTTYLRALHHQFTSHDFLLSDENGAVRECGRGAFVWFVGGDWQTVGSQARPTVNPVIQRGIERGVVRPRQLDASSLAALECPCLRISPDGSISQIASIDDRSLPVETALAEALAAHLGLK
jgi:hypothetical protein